MNQSGKGFFPINKTKKWGPTENPFYHLKEKHVCIRTRHNKKMERTKFFHANVGGHSSHCDNQTSSSTHFFFHQDRLIKPTHKQRLCNMDS